MKAMTTIGAVKWAEKSKGAIVVRTANFLADGIGPSVRRNRVLDVLLLVQTPDGQHWTWAVKPGAWVKSVSGIASSFAEAEVAAIGVANAILAEAATRSIESSDHPPIALKAVRQTTV